MAKTNDIARLHEQFDAFTREGLEDVLRRVARFADTRVSARALSTFMRNAGGEPPERDEADSGPLRIVSGRLARAVSGKGREAVVRVSVENATLTYEKTVSVPYAAAHEFGATFTVPVTARMRRYFWAKHFETGEDKWMQMALTKKARFTIRIPARPYLGPALEAEAPAIQAFGEKVLFETFRKFLRAGL